MPSDLTAIDAQEPRTPAPPESAAPTSVSHDRLLLAAVGFLLIAQLPMLLRFYQRLWHVEHYSFFPAAYVGVIILVRRIVRSGTVDLQPGQIPVGLSLLSVLLLATSIVLDSPWFAALSFALTLLIAAEVTGGAPLRRALIPAWLLFMVTIPPPLNLDLKLIQGMQQVATVQASEILDLLHSRHYVSGVVMHTTRADYWTEEACSGVHSLFTAIACVIFFSVAQKRGFLRSSLLICVSAFWVVVFNAIRIASVTYLHSEHGLPSTAGWLHDGLGYVLFALMLLCVGSSDFFLSYLIPVRERSTRSKRSRGVLRRLLPSNRTRTDIPSATHKPSGKSGRGRWKPALLSFACLALCLLQVSSAVLAARSPKTAEQKFASTAMEADEVEFLRGNRGDWSFLEFRSLERDTDHLLGSRSHIAEFQLSDLTAAVSLDGPFDGWHNLADCFAAQGWSLDDIDHRFAEKATTKPAAYTMLRMHRGSEGSGIAFFASFDRWGRPLIPQRTFFDLSAGSRFRTLRGVLQGLPAENSGDFAELDAASFQIQVFCKSLRTLTAADEQHLLRLFEDTCQAMSEQTVPQDGR